MIAKRLLKSILMLIIVLSVGVAASTDVAMAAPPIVTTYSLPLWTSFSNPPGKMTSGGAFYRDGKITVVGSMNAREIAVVDVATWTATEIMRDNCSSNELPCWLTTSSAGYAWTGKAFFVAGGAMTWDEDNPTNKIRRYDPVLQAFTDTGMVLPQAWLDGAAVWHEDEREVWMIAGADQTPSPAYTNHIWTYSPERGVVEIRGALPHNTDNSCVVYDPVHKSIWVIGGHANGVFYDDVIEILPSGATRVAGHLPHTIDSAGCMLKDGVIYIAGGRSAEISALDTVYAFDTATGTVSQVATLQHAMLVRAWASDPATGRLWLVTGGNYVEYVDVN